ncbi:MAG TPA: thiamine diphosphokinase [Candidatus Thermoplasmatota archaeon]|nr:thiamine diphosphokinase [Candidatus Thermoplasmatota archaeon]
MKVALVLNGEPPSAAELAMLDACGAVVCADGGTAAVLASGRTPTLIVGDLDSLAPEVRAQAEQRGARIRALPAAKDETDGDRALEAALELTPNEVLVLGGHGRRSAMFLANLALLRRLRAAGVAATMVGQGEIVQVLGAGDELALGAWIGRTVNVLPLGEGCAVSLEGTAWPLRREPLPVTTARGTSNRIVAASARAEVHAGEALVIVETSEPGLGWLRPPDGPGVAYEFFAPFAHVPGKYEWCRLRSPTHGVFDCFILLGATTSAPATVYVSSEAGSRFLRERFPRCAAHRVPVFDLGLREEDDGRTVIGMLRASAGPVREVDLRFTAQPGAPTQAAYGGEGQPVWGSALACWGVDLNLPARAVGHVLFADGRRDALDGAAAIVTLGSFGRLAPLPRDGT